MTFTDDDGVTLWVALKRDPETHETFYIIGSNKTEMKVKVDHRTVNFGADRVVPEVVVALHEG